jgi:hypothetical protein
MEVRRVVRKLRSVDVPMWAELLGAQVDQVGDNPGCDVKHQGGKW